MINKRDHVSDRLDDATDAVKQAWSGARDRSSDVIDAARETIESAREKLGSGQDALADQLESAAAALRRHSNVNPLSRITRDQPMPAVIVAFAVGALVGALGSLLVSTLGEE